MARLREAGYTNAPSTFWALYSGVPITQEYYAKQAHISQTYRYSKNARLAIYQPCTLDGDIIVLHFIGSNEWAEYT